MADERQEQVAVEASALSMPLPPLIERIKGGLRMASDDDLMQEIQARYVRGELDVRVQEWARLLDLRAGPMFARALPEPVAVKLVLAAGSLLERGENMDGGALSRAERSHLQAIQRGQWPFGYYVIRRPEDAR